MDSWAPTVCLQHGTVDGQGRREQIRTPVPQAAQEREWWAPGPRPSKGGEWEECRVPGKRPSVGCRNGWSGGTPAPCPPRAVGMEGTTPSFAPRCHLNRSAPALTCVVPALVGERGSAPLSLHWARERVGTTCGRPLSDPVSRGSLRPSQASREGSSGSGRALCEPGHLHRTACWNSSLANGIQFTIGIEAFGYSSR